MHRSLSASRELLKVFRALKASPLTSSFHGESLPVRAICSRQSFPFTLRGLTTTPILSGTPEDLERAKQQVGTLTEDPGNEVKLKLYALFKQVTLYLWF